MSRKTTLGLVVGIASLSALAGCSSMHDKSAMATDPTASKVVGLQENVEYMNRVEKLARDRGIRLTWVNPPQRHPQQQSN